MKLDFGLRGFGFLTLYVLALVLTFIFLTPYTISVDGFSYLKSSEALFTKDFAVYYTWLREPGYPLFIRFFEDLGGLFLVILIQGLVVAFGILATFFSALKLLQAPSVSWKTFASATIAVVLVAGYATALLQQSAFIGLFGLLTLIISRIVTKPTFDPVTALLSFVLILISTSVAVFMGLAFGLALFATIVFIKVFDVKLIVSYSLLAAIAFATVMVPWSQIKSEQAPVDAYDAVSMATFSASKTLNEFNPEKVFYEAFQTQFALLNLVGELPPSSGLMIANENRIFGAPVYGENDNCGRFLTGIDPDWLWGPIETTYDDRCVPQESLELISGINRVSQIFYPLVGLSLLFVLILSIGFQSNLRPIIFPAFLITLPYIVMSASISRYGALIIPLGAFLLLELITPKGLLSKSETPLGVSKVDESNEKGK